MCFSLFSDSTQMHDRLDRRLKSDCNFQISYSETFHRLTTTTTGAQIAFSLSFVFLNRLRYRFTLLIVSFFHFAACCFAFFLTLLIISFGKISLLCVLPADCCAQSRAERASFNSTFITFKRVLISFFSCVCDSCTGLSITALLCMAKCIISISLWK